MLSASLNKTFLSVSCFRRARSAVPCLWENLADCNSVQLAFVENSMKTKFGYSVPWTFEKSDALSVYSKLVSSSTEGLSQAFKEPKFALFDMCFAVKAIGERFKDVFAEIDKDLDLTEQSLQPGLKMLKMFLLTVCSDSGENCRHISLVLSRAI